MFTRGLAHPGSAAQEAEREADVILYDKKHAVSSPKRLAVVGQTPGSREFGLAADPITAGDGSLWPVCLRHGRFAPC